MPARSKKSSGLSGDITVPGDKSISHRALLLGSQAVGESRIRGLLEGEDVIRTAECLRTMGVPIRKEGEEWVVNGVGVGGLAKPSDVLDMGNSGTGARLLMGLIAPYPFKTTITGDESLTTRPMKRVMTPLAEMGAQMEASDGGTLPLTMQGNVDMFPIEYRLPVASAQVKSAILLAALSIPGETTVIEPEHTRDHTERMLTAMGAEIEITDMIGGRHITLKGQPELTPQQIDVPADPSSAAFPVVAALITPNSDVTVQNVCMNETRTGLFTTLLEMGAEITYSNERDVAGENVADITAKTSTLKGVVVPAERAPSMIDEYPILSVAASFAEGETRMEGLAELRVKESDRFEAILDLVNGNGGKAEADGDAVVITGSKPSGGGMVQTNLDHRIGMSALVMGMATEQPVTIDDETCMATSFPGFVAMMNGLGGKIGV